MTYSRENLNEETRKMLSMLDDIKGTPPESNISTYKNIKNNKNIKNIINNKKDKNVIINIGDAEEHDPDTTINTLRERLLYKAIVSGIFMLIVSAAIVIMVYLTNSGILDQEITTNESPVPLEEFVIKDYTYVGDSFILNLNSNELGIYKVTKINGNDSIELKNTSTGDTLKLPKDALYEYSVIGE